MTSNDKYDSLPINERSIAELKLRQGEASPRDLRAINAPEIDFLTREGKTLGLQELVALESGVMDRSGQEFRLKPSFEDLTIADSKTGSLEELEILF